MVLWSSKNGENTLSFTVLTNTTVRQSKMIRSSGIYFRKIINNPLQHTLISTHFINYSHQIHTIIIRNSKRRTIDNFYWYRTFLWLLLYVVRINSHQITQWFWFWTRYYLVCNGKWNWFINNTWYWTWVNISHRADKWQPSLGSWRFREPELTPEADPGCRH